MNPAGLCGFVAAAAAVVASAQTSEAVDEAFSADRPGFATSPSVLGRGRTQLEGGVTFSVDADGEVRQHSLAFGSPLIRIGIGRSVELRAGGDGFRLARRNDFLSQDSASGWSDVAIGAKLALVNQGRIVPAISLLPSLSVPVGHEAFTSSTYDPSLGVAWFKTLSAGLSLGGTLTGTRITDEGVRHARYTSAISLGIPAPARSAVYVEIYAVSSVGPRGTTTWISDAGISRSLGANLQIDIETGRRVSSGAPCWFIASGFALRYASLFRR